jgi:adenine C2-methylase RlmN of 23S rRNA A2503 and tRNA A37
MEFKRFDSSEGNVWKYVFDFGNAVAEAVLYKYESFYKRTVLCISVQSGCPVGCKFCGTGESDTVVQVPKAPVHRDRRLQFFQERCLSLKQEFSTYLGNL